MLIRNSREKDNHKLCGDTVSAEDIHALAASGTLRYKSPSSSGLWGEAGTFSGDLERAADVLLWSLDAGIASIYRDDDGFYVGPSYQFLLEMAERDPNAEGGALQ